MIYFDHAATSLPRAESALVAAHEAAAWPNAGRGLTTGAVDAQAAVDRARAAVRSLVGFGTVCFVSGATHGLNQLILGLRPRPGGIALDPLAHNATRRPAYAVGSPVWTMPHDRVGLIDLVALERDWRAGTELVVLTHGSNVTGRLQPVGQVAEIAHERGARVVVDAAQTIGAQLPLQVGDADAVAFSAHKGLAALPGVGAIVVRDEVVLEPLLSGGTGHDAVSEQMPAKLPSRVEAGTLNLPGIAAFAAAAQAATAEPWDYRAAAGALHEAVRRSGAQLVDAGELPVVSTQIQGMTPLAAEELLDRAFAISCRAGLHCAPLAHQTLGTADSGGTLRISAGRSTSEADLAQLTRALKHIGGMSG